MDAAGPGLTPRLAAARVLVALERGRTTLADEVERDRRDLADPRDRGLFLEITTGALRWQGALDATLAGFSRQPLQKLAPEIRAILRLAAYQLLHLDRVPAHAVVHESVETAKQMGLTRAAGFVNAVLRSLLRAKAGGDDQKNLNLPPRPKDRPDRHAEIDYLSITLSHPRWLVTRWLDAHGFDATEAWCQFNNAPPSIGVRVKKIPGIFSADDIQKRFPGSFSSPISSSAIRLPPGALGKLPADVRDQLIVQDEGSQFVAESAGAEPGSRVLDLCASPGGKSLWLHEAVAPDGLVIACDFRPRRVALLARQIREHAGAESPGIAIVRLDASKPLPFKDVFDHVLLDAPCSGLGTLRRDPDLKWTRRPEQLAEFAAAQRDMIAAAAEAVRPGGTLTYATCSSEPEENEDVVSSFLTQRPDFTLVHAQRTWPFTHATDAFYAAQLRRVEPA